MRVFLLTERWAGIVFETFKLWFDKLRAMDTTLQQLFSHVDSSQGLAHIQGHGRVLLPDRNKSKGLPTPVGFVGPSGVRTLLQVRTLSYCYTPGACLFLYAASDQAMHRLGAG